MISASLKHYMNPLHIYCWLMEEFYFLPESKRKNVAYSLSKFYEINIYNGNGGARLTRAVNFSSKLLKTLTSHSLNEKN